MTQQNPNNGGRSNNFRSNTFSNGHQGDGYQRNNAFKGSDPNQAERMQLKEEMRKARQALAQVDAKLTALYTTKQQIDAELIAHQQAIPGVALMEIGRLVSNAVGIPFLPPAYKSWYYKNERMHEIQRGYLYQEALLLNQRQAIALQIEEIQIDLDLLRQYPDQQ